MTDSTYRTIGTAFQNEGFAPDADGSWDDGSVRHTFTELRFDPGAGCVPADGAGGRSTPA